jgi:molybdate-binding protein
MTRVIANGGVRIRNARTARGYTQLELARRASISRQALGAIEAGLYQVNFARWELGLAVASGNPLHIRDFADLQRPRVGIVNREIGSGARMALDEGLKQLGVRGPRINGYARELPGHLEIAEAVAGGQADAGVTIRFAAEAYSLTFIPLREERYDLVALEEESSVCPVKALLEALNSRRLASEINQLCGYDTTQMGQVIARSD